MTAQQAVNELLRRIPEFATERSRDPSYLSYDDDSPYLVFGDFARFIINLITKELPSPRTTSLLARSFELLEAMATSPNNEIANLAEAGVFEVLTDRPEAILAARQHLAGEASNKFEHLVELWAPKHKLSEQ